MNFLLISYGDLDYDGRLRSLLMLFSKLGSVFSYTRGNAPISDRGRVCKSTYSTFIKDAIKYAKKIGEIDVLVLDNRKATIPGMIIKKILKPQIIIQDCRELYLFNEVKHFTGKVGCLFEKRMIKKADIVICANEERATIMQRIYNLSQKPLPYENLRRLEYSTDDNLEEIRDNFAKYIKEDEIRIISSSGCSINRTNDILVENLVNVKRKCRLFLVGTSDDKEKSKILEIANKDKVNDVTILGQLNQAELKYLISKCHIGVVNYGQYDTNNRYCASGKLYEFLYEGIPVVTTTNPPLKKICDKEKIGVADNNYYEGINRIIDEYETFKENVSRFTSDNTIARNDANICLQIKKLLSDKLKEG